MTLPTANHIATDPTFVTDAIQEFPDTLQDKEYFIKLASWYAKRWKSLDDEVIKLAYYRLLDNAEGVVLDNIGLTLGVPRYDQTDSSYRGRIKLRSLRQTTDGTRSEIVNLLSIIFSRGEVDIYKGVNGYLEVSVPVNCLDNTTVAEELENLFPIKTNLSIMQYENDGDRFRFIDLKDMVQPDNTQGLISLGDTGEGSMSDLIHTSYKQTKIKG